LRTTDENGKIKIEKAPTTPLAAVTAQRTRGRLTDPTPVLEHGRASSYPVMDAPAREPETTRRSPLPEARPPASDGRTPLTPIKIYPYGVARNRLMQSAKRIGVPAIVVRTLDEADALITLRSYYRDHQATIAEAEERGMPIYVLRANSVNQIEQFLTDLYNLPGSDSVAYNNAGNDDIRDQTQAAISAVMNGERYVDMPPANPITRRIQHEMARAAELVSHSYGKEPRRHVRIFRD
jgi:hypothetical protein